jgi:hypothetical protein
MKPILFNGEMVRAILDGSKTQTRRVVDSIAGMGRVTEFQASQTPGYAWTFRDRRSLWNDLTDSQLLSHCPFGKPGDRLWVREAFRPYPPQSGNAWEILYAADAEVIKYEAPSTYRPMLYNYERWYPSIHMPRWASRITIEVTDVRVQRLQDISEEDARSEGLECYFYEEQWWYYVPEKIEGCVNYLPMFCQVWDSCFPNPLTPPVGRGWHDNPWVWAISFKRVEV